MLLRSSHPASIKPVPRFRVWNLVSYHRFRSCHALSGRPWAEGRNPVYGFSVKLAFRQVGPKSFIPVTGFISKSRNHPFEQIGFPQHHHGKVLFSVPFFVCVLCSLLVTIYYHGFFLESRKKSCELRKYSQKIPEGKSAFGDESILALHGKPLADFLPKGFRGGDLHRGSKGQNADQDFRFIVFVIVERHPVVGFVQPFGLLFQMGKM